jgi:bifunctional DNA-binding transcriptional regulator/antitoxin component of YhaV-PrlF toxin-antitoxin module
MESRKVQKIKNSFYVNIPSEISEGLKIEKGDSLKIGYLAGYGILMTRDKGVDKISVNIEGVDRLQRAADNTFSDLRRKAKSFEASFTFNIMNRLIGELMKTGWIDLKGRVEKLETKFEVSGERRGKLVLLDKKKRSDQ